MLPIALAVLCGVLSVQCLAQLPAPPVLYWVLPLLIVSACFSRTRLLTWLLVGFLWSWWQAEQRLANDLSPALEGKDIVVRGQVASLPESDDRAVRFTFHSRYAQQGSEWIAFTPTLRLSWYHTATLQLGDTWQLRVRLKRRYGFHNPGGFDYEGWLFQQGINATGYVRAGEPWSGDGTPVTVGMAMRAAVDTRLESQLKGTRQPGILRALSLGARDQISSSQWDAFRATGTSHLIAISGLHIGLVAGLAFACGRWLWARSHFLTHYLAAPRAGAVAGLIAATCYALLAGFSIPTQRAWIMATVMLINLLLRRASGRWQALALALLLVVVWDPVAVVSPGFWLSFAAVAIIFSALTGRVGSAEHVSLRERVIQLVRVQLLLSFGLLPLTLLFFGQIGWTAPIANLIAVPWTSLVLVPILFAGLISLYPCAPLSRFLLEAAGWAADALVQLLTWASALPMATLDRPELPVTLSVLAAAGVALLLLPRGLPRRLSAGLLLLPLLLTKPERPPPGQIWFTLLDVGQGLAAVIRTRDHTLVYDSGPRFSADFDAGSAVVAPFLSATGITHIDTLVVSHGDNDHRGGARALAARVPVYRLLTSVPERIDWRYSTACRAGQAWSWDDVTFRLLHPQGTAAERGNDASCVLQIETARGERILLTGDIEAAAESQLVRDYGDRLASEVLLMPHHGSRTSSTATFLDQVRPDLALIPAGYRNRYGFPKSDVLARYRQRGIQLRSSAGSGALTVRLGVAAGKVVIEEDRLRRRRYWQAPATVPLDQ